MFKSIENHFYSQLLK